MKKPQMGLCTLQTLHFKTSLQWEMHMCGCCHGHRKAEISSKNLREKENRGLPSHIFKFSSLDVKGNEIVFVS